MTRPLDNEEYGRILKIAVDEATDLAGDKRPDRDDHTGWDEFHQQHFGRVLTVVDNSELSWVEAEEVSQICQEVENDIRYGDILGL